MDGEQTRSDLVREARRDAVALVTAADAGMRDAIELLMSSWVGPESTEHLSAPGQLLTDELLGLAATFAATVWDRSGFPRGLFPPMNLQHADTVHARATQVVLAAVNARLLGQEQPILELDGVRPVHVLLASAVLASTLLPLAAEVQGLSPQDLLTSAGIAAAR